MNERLKKIQKQVEKEFVLDQYKATLEMLKKCEMGIAFLETQEAKDLQGEEAAKSGLLSYEETKRVKTAERDFLEKYLSQ